ncbi:hypothetical protein CEXT_131291, partial [Caerostris extrusa]
IHSRYRKENNPSSTLKLGIFYSLGVDTEVATIPFVCRASSTLIFHNPQDVPSRANPCS